jgi:hypothetical protein
MSTSTINPVEIGTQVGQAMFADAVKNNVDLEWTGIEAQDADQFVAAGLEIGSDEWEEAEEAALAAYVEAAAGTRKLEGRDECGSDMDDHIDHYADAEDAEKNAEDDAREYVEEWCKDGEWGNEGASIDLFFSVRKIGDDGKWEAVIDDESFSLDISPDHDAMIRAAGGDTDCDHEWTAEGEGGCNENPGVWSTGGTSMTFATHCKHCGLHRIERSTGSQRNPGEHDTVSYKQPATWCAECRSEECECGEDE